jgi:hypothetical protein
MQQIQIKPGHINVLIPGHKLASAGDVVTLSDAEYLALDPALFDVVFTTLGPLNTAQPLDSDLTAIASLTTTAFGRSLLGLADAAAGRTALGSQRVHLFHARDYCPVVDGTTDNTAGLQAAIDACAAAGGGVVVLDAGVWRASNLVGKQGVTLSSLNELKGYPPSAVNAALIKANAAGWVIDTPASAIAGFAVVGVNIDGNSVAGGIRLRNTSRGAIRRVTINATSTIGLKLESTASVCIVDDVLVLNALQGAVAAQTGAVDIDGNDHVVRAVEATASLSGITDANLWKAAIVIRGANGFYSDLVGEISDIGIALIGNWNRLVNCRADLNWGHGWYITGSKNTVTAPISLSNGRQTTGTYSGFQATVASGQNHFLGARVDTAIGNTVLYGIDDAANTSNARDRNTWTDPQINPSACVNLHSTVYFLGSGISYPPHPVRPANAATSFDVSLTSLVVLHSWTGTATLAAMTGAAHGQQVTILGPTAVGAALTIPNNSTFKTLTAGSIRLELGCSAIFTHYNGVWYQTGGTSLAGTPPMVSGRYYRCPACTLTTSATTTNGIMRLVPKWIPNTITVAKICAEVTTIGEAGSKVRLGIYADDGTGRPGSLVVDAGQIAGDSATVQEITDGVTQLTGGRWYWFAVAAQSCPTTPPTLRVINVPMESMPIDQGTSPLTGGYSAYGWTQTGVTGALPGTAAPTTQAGAAVPAVHIKVA